MALEDRDRNFEKALARYLRPSASRGAAESAVSKMAACPDAETLAAFHERTLLPEEWDRVNLHVAGCSHCMTLLAQLEATDAIALEAHPTAESQTQTLAATSAAPAATAAAATSAPPGKSRRVVRLPGARWHYLAPAGALAAGLLVWIAVHENGFLTQSGTRPLPVASNQAPTPIPQAASRTAPASENKTSALAKNKPAESLTATSDLAANKRTVDARTPSQSLDDYAKNKTPAAKKEASDALLAEKESRAKKDSGREVAAKQLPEELDAARDQKAAGGAVQQNTDALLPAQVQNNAQNQANSNLPKVAGPAPLGQVAMNRSAAAKPAPAPSASSVRPMVPPSPSEPSTARDQVSKFASSAAVETVSGFANPRLITVPGSSFAWRVGRSGVIEFSRDDGTSWTRQSSGVSADLLSGSAPSDRTCWIVGRAGTILLTTDSGAHWKLLKPPFAEDFGGIRATDMLHATVWNSRNTLNYQTADGGANWTPVPNP